MAALLWRVWDRATPAGRVALAARLRPVFKDRSCFVRDHLLGEAARRFRSEEADRDALLVLLHGLRADLVEHLGPGPPPLRGPDAAQSFRLRLAIEPDQPYHLLRDVLPGVGPEGLAALQREVVAAARALAAEPYRFVGALVLFAEETAAALRRAPGEGTLLAVLRLHIAEAAALLRAAAPLGEGNAVMAHYLADNGERLRACLPAGEGL